MTGTSGTPAPTGSITFKDGAATLGIVTLGSGGVAKYTTAALAAASHTITASYGGDTSNAPSTSSVTVTVNPPTSTTTSLTSSGSSVVVGTSLTLTATVAGTAGTPVPSGIVTFKDGSTTLGTGTVNSSKVASYSTSSLAAGSHSITASYAGDTSNGASVSAAVAVAVWPGPPDFTVSLSPTTATIKGGTPAVITITVTSVNGFNAATTLSCGSLPKDTTCTFSSASLTPAVSGTGTSTLTIDTNTNPATAVEPLATRSNPAGRHSGRPAALAGLFAALLLIPFFGFRKGRVRKLFLGVASMVILATLAMAGLGGCGGGPTTPKGTYPITVTAVSGSTTHTATYTLTVN